MDFMKNIKMDFMQSIKNIININYLKVIPIFIPLYYANFISTNICISYTINNVYLYYLYSNKDMLIDIINYNKDSNYIYIDPYLFCEEYVKYKTSSIIFNNLNIVYILLYIVPLTYILFLDIDLLQSIRITSIYTYEIINNKDFIINVLNNIGKNICLYLLDHILTIKINIINYYKSFFDYKFILIKAHLYTDLSNNINVTRYLKSNLFDKIDNNLIKLLFILNNIEFNVNDDIRLKIYFKYEQIDYIIYYPYKIAHEKKIDKDDYYLPYPIYNIEIMDNFRNDIVLPYYKDLKKQKVFYSLFHIESKDILLTCINDIHNDQLYKYFNLIKTPFNDFGILYNVPVKLRWILIENNIDIETFNNIYFKFLSIYFCEKDCDIKEHYVKMDNNDLDKVFISERMKDILSLE
jgi:hypothetical protein